MKNRRVSLELFSASFAALLLELALIRWLPERVRVIAYFPNLILIASFLGLGVGALSRSFSGVWVGLFALITVTLGVVLGRIAFTANGASEHLWLLYYDLPKDALVVNNVVLPITLVFVATAIFFLPLGGLIANRIQFFTDQRRTLDGYLLDLAGSLAGVVAFLGLAALGSRPVWWFALALASVAIAMGGSWRNRCYFFLLAVGSLAVVRWSDHAEIYSPYYAITTRPWAEDSVLIMTNGSVHQQAIDLRPSSSPVFQKVREGYNLPWKSLAKPPQRALVLGAGSGNDVAVLLAAGVPEVHAVEIDPVIIKIGRERHPAHPYQDSRVVIHNSDARAFLESTDLKFDLIVFGTLDSMTRLSALSNVRLDNFVYTVESLRAAGERLSDDGGLALMFMAGTDEIKAHLYGIFWDAFGRPPVFRETDYALFNTIYFTGPGFAHLREQPGFRSVPRLIASKPQVVPTDDWPYLYLASPGIPRFYLEIGAMIILVAAALLLSTSSALRRSLAKGAVDGEMIILGAAFLLCETGFVTQMNLLFGATWLTSAVIIGAILLALIGATALSRFKQIGARPALLATVLTLVIVSQLPLRQLAPATFGPRVLFALIVCGVPLTCAGLVFAARLSTRQQTSVAFGWNVLGAVLGGVLEMGSMLIGLRGILLGAAILYAAALFWSRSKIEPAGVSA